MWNTTKILKERIERLVNLATYNTIRMKLILDKAIDEINSIIADEIKDLDDIEMKTSMQEGKIRVEKIENSLDQFEMNTLEIKINNEIEISKNEEKKIRNVIDCSKKSWIMNSELWNLYTNKQNKDSTDQKKIQLLQKIRKWI